MAKRIEEIIAKLPPARRARVESKAKRLIADEMVLAELRKAVRLTQERVAERLHIGQDSVSRLEKRCDILVSTLREYIGAMGGKLRLVAEFPNRPPVEIAGLSSFARTDEPAKPRPR